MARKLFLEFGILTIIFLLCHNAKGWDLTNLGTVQGDDFLDINCLTPIFNFRLGRCEADREAKIGFLLFTKDNPVKPVALQAGDLEGLKRSPYIRGADLKVLIHGYIGSIDQANPAQSINAYVKLQGDQAVNVIAVDWSAAASGGFVGFGRPYTRSASCTMSVAGRTAEFIKFLIDQGYVTMNQVHVVGHSLGAHLAGMVGREFGGELGRITGLDPARPCFRAKDAGYPHRLTRDDAHFVDVIHTDGENGNLLGQGLIEALGHADFYPNGGTRRQPGCSKKRFSPLPDSGCGHNRAPELWAESILSPKAFIGRRCDSWDNFQTGKCIKNKGVSVMGEHAKRPLFAPDGIRYYLRTTSSSPYGLGAGGAQTGNF